MTLSPDIEKANRRYLIQEVFWMGVAFSLEWYFLNVFAIGMGATAAQLGALASLRALMLVIGSSLSSRWTRRFDNMIVALRVPSFFHRAGMYLGVALVAFLPEHMRVNALIGTVALSGLPTGIAQGCFLGMMRTAVSERQLANLMSRRSILMHIAVLVCVILFGQLLEQVAFPINYQISFSIAFCATLISWWNVQKIKVANTPAFATQAEIPSPHINVWKHPVFPRLALLVFVIHFSVFMGAPLVQYHLVRNLGASDSWISVFGLFEMAAGMLIMLRIERLLAIFGTVRMIIIMAFATFIQTFVLGLTPILPPHIIGQLLFGAGWFSLGLLQYKRLTEIAPVEGFPQFAATYILLINAAFFTGPLVSTFLIENVMSVPAALLLIAVLRFGAGILAWVLNMRPAPVAAEQQATP
jgi:predicted MFS family arabinose efflux permease